MKPKTIAIMTIGLIAVAGVGAYSYNAVTEYLENSRPTQETTYLGAPSSKDSTSSVNIFVNYWNKNAASVYKNIENNTKGESLSDEEKAEWTLAKNFLDGLQILAVTQKEQVEIPGRPPIEPFEVRFKNSESFVGHIFVVPSTKRVESIAVIHRNTLIPRILLGGYENSGTDEQVQRLLGAIANNRMRRVVAGICGETDDQAIRDSWDKMQDGSAKYEGKKIRMESNHRMGMVKAIFK